MQHTNLFSFFLAATALFIASCAQVVSPTGGPKDLTPPAIMESDPENFSTGFSDLTLKITFDEFVRLNDVQKHVILSPPVSTAPDFKLRKKTLVVQFKEPLKENTTYTVFFGAAITDITENNPAGNLRYVFSTGPYLDSLSIKGMVNDAETLLPDAELLMMLYDGDQDSLPLTIRPYYVARPDKLGQFSFENIKPGRFKLFGLKDMNNNYRFDMPNEKIAFCDSLITAVYVGQKTMAQPDSLLPDSLRTDTLSFVPVVDSVDTCNADAGPRNAEQKMIRLYSFLEQDTAQKLLNMYLADSATFRILFKQPVNALLLNTTDTFYSHNWYAADYNKTRDSITVWLLNIPGDSIELQVGEEDSVFRTRKYAVHKELKPFKKENKQMVFAYEMSVRNKGEQPYFKPLSFTSSRPINELQADKISLLHQIDSAVYDTLLRASYLKEAGSRSFLIDHSWEEGGRYLLNMLPGAFTDIFGLMNDSIQLAFSATKAEQYGSLYLSVILPEQDWSYVIELTDKNGRIYQKQRMPSDGRLEFLHLKPGEYRMQAYRDGDANMQWDTGNYRQHRQPEKKYIFPGPVKVRANWDMELDWELK